MLSISKSANLRTQIGCMVKDVVLNIPDYCDLSWTKKRFVENFADYGVSIKDTQLEGIGNRIKAGGTYTVKVWDVKCNVDMCDCIRFINVLNGEKIGSPLIPASYKGQFLLRELMPDIFPQGLTYSPGYRQDLWNYNGAAMVSAYDLDGDCHLLASYDECKMWQKCFITFQKV